MRAFSQTFPFAPEPAGDADIRVAISLADDPVAPRVLPSGRVATAVLKALAKEEAGDIKDQDVKDRGVDDAWLDSTLEDSFPASDPFVGNYCN